MRWLVPNLIFALHGLAFYILFDLVFHLPLNAWGIEHVGYFIFPVLMLGFALYLILDVQRVYYTSGRKQSPKPSALSSGLEL